MGLAARLLRRRWTLALDAPEGPPSEGRALFALRCEQGGALPGGPLLIRSRIHGAGASARAQLEYDCGEGFRPGQALFAGITPGGSINELVALPAGATRLRWRLSGLAGEFRHEPIELREITALEHFARRLIRVLRMRRRTGAPRVALRRLVAALDAHYALATRARARGAELAPRALRVQRDDPNAGRFVAGEGGPRHALHLDLVSESLISGSVLDREAPDAPVMLELDVDGRRVERRLADEDGRCAGEPPGWRFEFSLPEGSRGSATSVALFAEGSDTPAGECRLVYLPREQQVRALMAGARGINAAHADAALDAARLAAYPPAIAALRAAWAELPEVVVLPWRSPPSEKVDVIVPVHGGVEQTLACLHSLAAARVGTPCEVVVVNDAAPDARMAPALAALAAEGRITLLENPANLGFVRSVNRAMRLHPGRDVVLLNSDTEVADGWLDRLRAAAYRAPDIGTATPLSNRATICSFPQPHVDNELPAGAGLRELAAACAAANDGVSVEIPTAVGFCMFIRRAALQETGGFDERRWGRGYGEENDFCLRAAERGWRHVAACDVFVLHHGSVSFGAERSALAAENTRRLASLYPEYRPAIAAFASADPLTAPRRRLFEALAAARRPRYVLFVVHAWSGGSAVAAEVLAQRLAGAGEGVLFLGPEEGGGLALRVFGSSLECSYRGEACLDEAHAGLRRLNVWHVHVHQLVGFAPPVGELVRRLGVPYDVSVHDYYYACPRLHLMNAAGSYCGEPDEAGCDACLQRVGPHPATRAELAASGGSIAGWRARHARFLAGARRVFAPSLDVESRMRRYFPDAALQLKPAPEPEPAQPAAHAQPPAGSAVNVAVIGALGQHKGMDLLLDCARDAAARGLALRFVVIGKTEDDTRFAGLANVHITGPYARGDVARLCAQHGCSLAAFLSLVPETHCYTLSEAWAAGLYPVVLDIGAPAERVRAARHGAVAAFPPQPGALNDLLLRCAAERPAARAPQPQPGYAAALSDYYEFQDA
jgi:GT2 family glycosyltransferase